MVSWNGVDFLIIDQDTPMRTVPQPQRGQPAWTEFLIPGSMVPLRQFGGIKTWERWSNRIQGAPGLYAALKSKINTPATAITPHDLTGYPGWQGGADTQTIANVLLEDVQQGEWEVEGSDDHEQCVVMWARSPV